MPFNPATLENAGDECPICAKERLMPAGPKSDRRPADVIGDAVHVMKILTGEIDETIPVDGKDPAARALGKKINQEAAARFRSGAA
jgi:hypothetical protein